MDLTKSYLEAYRNSIFFYFVSNNQYNFFLYIPTTLKKR